MRLGSFLACAAVAPCLMAANQPLRLQPAGPWVVDYAEQSCRLFRKFGADDTETSLLFESEAPEEMDMLLIGKPLKSSGKEVPARFLPVQEKPDTGRPVTSANGGPPGALFSSVRLLPKQLEAKVETELKFAIDHPHIRPPATELPDSAEIRAARQDFATNADQLEIDARRSRPVILETGSMGQPIKMLDQCSCDSLKDWGVDPNLEDKIVRPVWLVNHDSLISPQDYPKDMLSDGQQSEVKVRVLVDAAGRVTKCTPLSHFKLPEFTQLVCQKITRNGRFEPAELADGTKVPSYYINRVVFQMRP
jgi:hypothetical protein